VTDARSDRDRPLPTVAVVLAGGTGSCVGLDAPRQLLKVAGRTILEHTIEALHAWPEVDELVVVMTADCVEDARELLLRPGRRPSDHLSGPNVRCGGGRCSAAR